MQIEWPQTKTEKIKLVVAIGICLAAGGIGSLFTSASVDTWYRALQKPPLNPPSWVFGPVWTALFVLMGIALYLVWKRVPLFKEETRALTWFGVQLLLNILWSFCFFYLREPGLAFFEIVILWLAIVMWMLTTSKVSKSAAMLLIPYIMWVSFASYLNLAIWRLNS